MAQKKGSKKSSSRAEKAVKTVKKKNAAEKAASEKKKAVYKESDQKESVITHNGAVAILSLAFFVLFLVISINDEGLILQAVKRTVTGLIGFAGFYLSIPALLYIFLIHTFGRKKSVHSRSLCALGFVLICGAVFHLLVQTQGHAQGFGPLVKDLFETGYSGSSGGVLCGGIALLTQMGLGRIVSFIVFFLAAAFLLLGAMQITVFSLITAIRNRPRDERWDEEEEYDRDADYVEPAEAVVNHIANRQIEHRRQKRQKQLEQQAAQQAVILEPPQVQQISGTPENAASVMNSIDMDISSPMGGAEREDLRPEPPRPPVQPVRKPRRAIVPEEEIPASMPELDLEEEALEEPELILPPRETPKPAVPVMVQKEQPKPKKEAPEISAQEQVANEIAQAKHEQTAYCFPPVDLLRRPVRGGVDGTDEMRENSQRLNETLASFHIDAHIINVTRGPSVTRYEVELDKGVRLNKLTGCADDIALSLGASGVRIAAVPGKISVVGIEVPNRSVTMVSLREVIDSPEFARAKSKSSFAVGKDIGGSCIVGNIAKMPHLLIAGTTGSGKSVCMNSIILSLLYKAGPP